MKKKTILTLMLTMSLTLSACGGPAAALSTTEANTPETTLVQETEAPQAPAMLPPFSLKGRIEETVLYEENGIRITATDLTYNERQVNLEMLVENIGEKKLSVIAGSLGCSANSVNGIMIDDGYIHCELEPGKKAKDSAAFDKNLLQLMGIQEIADIQMVFEIHDEDYEKIYTEPLTLKTSLYETHDYSRDYLAESMPSEAAQNTLGYETLHFLTEPLYEDSGVKSICGGMIRNPNGDPFLFLELENTTDQQMAIQMDDLSVNGLTVYAGGYPYTSNVVNPGKKALLGVDLSALLKDTYREVLGITEIGTVGFTLTQTDREGNLFTNPLPVTMKLTEAPLTTDYAGQEVYNTDGIRILALPICGEGSEYSDDLHLLMLIKNDTQAPLNVRLKNDSLSVNGFMDDLISGSAVIPWNSWGLLDLEFWSSKLEENGLTEPADFHDLELTLELRSGKKDLGEIPVKITY